MLTMEVSNHAKGVIYRRTNTSSPEFIQLQMHSDNFVPEHLADACEL